MFFKYKSDFRAFGFRAFIYGFFVCVNAALKPPSPSEPPPPLGHSTYVTRHCRFFMVSIQAEGFTLSKAGGLCHRSQVFSYLLFTTLVIA